MNTPDSSSVHSRSEERVDVLLVDDQMIIAEAVRRMFIGEAGVKFHYCAKGTDALATAARINPTVILQDLVMPDADGLDLVRGYRAQEATRLTPLIVLSSKEEGATKAEAFARGANDYIVKLPEPVELIARVRYHSRAYTALLERNQAFEDLRRSQESLAAELSKAAQYVRSLLPAPMTGDIAVAWKFVPSASLGGDCFDYFPLDEDRIAMYVLDVCGHGVGPALLGVSAMSAIRGHAADDPAGFSPSAVLRRLNAAFSMEKHHNMYFTVWCGVWRRSDRVLTYSGGGHPPPLLVSPGPPPRFIELETPGLPIGIMPDELFPEVQRRIEPGDSLLMYSDGAIEVFCEPGKLWGAEGIRDFTLARSLHDPAFVEDLHAHVAAMSGGGPLNDDFSAIAVRFGA